MPKDSFYLVEETIELIRAIEQNLELHKLDPRTALDLGDPRVKKNIHALVENLNALLAAGERDPRLLQLVIKVQGLRDFLQLLQQALAKSPTYPEWVQRQKQLRTQEEVNAAIDRIVLSLKEWEQLAEEKVHAHQRGDAQNAYLDELPQAPSTGTFYIMVKELNPIQTKFLHPIHPAQLALQQKRTTEELVHYDRADPIAGYRFYRVPGDSDRYPGSGLRITNGHHRLFELYRRYLAGELSGDQLVLLKIDYGHR